MDVFGRCCGPQPNAFVLAEESSVRLTVWIPKIEDVAILDTIEPEARSGPLARSVSKAADANAQFRPYMEDQYVAVDPFMAGHSTVNLPA